MYGHDPGDAAERVRAVLRGERTAGVQNDVVQAAAGVVGLLLAVHERAASDRHAAPYGVHPGVGRGQPRLQSEIEADATPGAHTVPCRLVVREST